MTLHTIDRPPSLVEKVAQSLAALVRSETHEENTSADLQQSYTLQGVLAYSTTRTSRAI